MRITLSTASIHSAKVDLIAVGVRSGKIESDPMLQRLSEAVGEELLSAAMHDEGFTGKRKQVLKLRVEGGLHARWLVLVGLGSGEPSESDARLTGHTAAKVAKRQRRAAVLPPATDEASVRAAVEGLLGGAYQYATYRSKKSKDGLSSATILVESVTAKERKALSAGTITAECINLARDLVNAPPNDMNPPALAQAAADESSRYGVSCKVWNKKQIEKAGMHLLLAVNRGSAIEPRFIHMSYEPKGAKRRVVFVGKGLTFDAGGLCLKPAKSMIDMKCDMAGAAVTIGVVLAAARLKLPIAVHGVVASTENMTGGNAYRPGDIFPSLDGKTVEIINTDAEGRLVLADALAYARELGGNYLIDHATLTGACMVALGPWRAGLYTQDERLASAYLKASSEVGESFWHMPLDADLRESLDSPIADLKHTGAPYGGSISAALFLQEFVGKSKWMHLDIAGPAFLEGPHGIMPKGGTGFGVATALRFLEALR